jgi:hypothetical protein
LPAWEDKLFAVIAEVRAEGVTPEEIVRAVARAPGFGKKRGRPKGSPNKEMKSQPLVKKLAIKLISDPRKGRYAAAREIEDSLPSQEGVTKGHLVHVFDRAFEEDPEMQVYRELFMRREQTVQKRKDKRRDDLIRREYNSHRKRKD